MKKKSKIIMLVLSCPLLIGAWIVAYSLASGPIFPDEQLEEAIRQELNYEKGEIRPDQLVEIQELRIRDRNIENLEGIEHLTSLVSLDLRDNHIEDISPLADLSEMIDLNLRGNQVSDIEVLSNLVTIRDLNLRENQIKDISALSELKELRDLNIRYNDVTNIEALENLDYLRERLYLEGNPITNYSPIMNYIDEIENHDISEDDYEDIAEFNPIFSHEGGFYDESFHLELTSPIEDSTIYYTLDGSVPDPENNAEHTYEYEESIEIDNKTNEENNLSTIQTNFISGVRGWKEPTSLIDKGVVVKAVIVDNEQYISDVATHSYFIQFSSTFPVISLSTNPNHLFDEDTGIYVPGVNYDSVSSEADDTGNYYQRGREWERPIHIEYFEADGNLAFSQGAGVRIHGGFTRRFAQKSLRLYSRSDYGESRFTYQFFDDKEIEDFNRLLLRNSGNDWGMTMFRDAAMQSLVGHLDLDRQSYQPSIVFLNGEYWGIHNVRDRLDKHYLETHYGADRDQFTILEREGQLSDGLEKGQEDYENMIDYVNSHDLAEEEHYHHVETLMDIDNYIQYYVTQIYNANSDWPHNNIDFWRYENIHNESNLTEPLDGRWRWFLYDVDRSLGYESYDHNTIEMVTSTLNPRHNEEWPNILFRALLDNDHFKNKFMTELADHLNTTFHEERVIQTVNEFHALYEPEIEKHIDRWGIPESVEAWNEEVEVMRIFATNRPNIVREHVVDYFGLTGTSDVRVISDTEKGKVIINSLEITEDTPGIESAEEWTGRYFQGVPIMVTAVPNEGFSFAGWGEEIDADSDSIEIILDRDIVLEPVFE